MNSEIKFELVGLNVKFNEIVREVVTLQQLIDGNYSRSSLPSFFNTNNGNCEFIAARRFTGLKDKNGKEIYEGDIVKTSAGGIRVVEWDQAGFWLRDTDMPLYDHHDLCEVIGNELLK